MQRLTLRLNDAYELALSSITTCKRIFRRAQLDSSIEITEWRYNAETQFY